MNPTLINAVALSIAYLAGGLAAGVGVVTWLRRTIREPRGRR